MLPAAAPAAGCSCPPGVCSKLLGRTAPPKMNNIKRVPMFNLLPTAIRKLNNPRATVKSVMASLQRNLAGFSADGGEA